MSPLQSGLRDSVIRTLVPVFYALLLRYVARHLGLDEAWLNGAAALLATGVVYVAIRAAEAKKAWFGWLLGSPKQPIYVHGEVAETAVEAVKAVEAGKTPPAAAVARVDPTQAVVEVDPPPPSA